MINTRFFTLKQHTPLIHFQHEQEGATLRASEVKPKLDRFIIEQLTSKKGNEAFGEFLANPEWKKWLIGNGEHPALDYRMKFTLNSAAKKIEINYTRTNDGKFRPNFPTIFGNVEKESEKKVFIFCESQEITINSFSTKLISEISKYISHFFFLTNFGFRQSKGFGSFSIGDFQPNKQYISFNLHQRKDDFKGLFSDIDLFYRCLKSGLNIKTKDENGVIVDKIYFKSLIFKFAKNLHPPEQWDKRTLRHSLYFTDLKYKNDSGKTGVYYDRTNKDGTVHYSTSKPPNRNYYDFRDLLGLSTEQDWLYYRNKKLIKIVSKIIITDNKNETIQIGRAQSPLTLKPFFANNQWYIYIVTTELPENYLGAKVTAAAGPNSTELTIYPSFNVDNFLKFAIHTFDKNDITYGEGFDENTNEAKTIINIYSQLKQQISNAKA